MSHKTLQSFRRVLSSLTDSSASNSTPPLHGIGEMRARRAGSLIYVDLVANVSGTLSVQEASEIEETISDTLKKQRKEVAEVRVKFHPIANNSN